MTHPVIKRAYDVSFAALGLAILSPLLALIALAVKLSDFGPVFFLQERIGQFGRPFRIWKFRTMIVNAENFGLSITRRGDRRITRIGRILRATKLDELPQLWNVLRGDMSLVGPRPEVPHYVARYTPEQRRVLELMPGMTDVASLAFRNEERMLGAAQDPEKFYIEHCLPRKIEMNLEYNRQANLLRDTWVILRTLSPVQFVQGPLHQAEPARGRG